MSWYDLSVPYVCVCAKSCNLLHWIGLTVLKFSQKVKNAFSYLHLCSTVHHLLTCTWSLVVYIISLSFWIAMHFNLACFLDIELLKELHSFEGYKITLLNYGHVLNTREFYFGALKLYFNETNYRHCWKKMHSTL